MTAARRRQNQQLTRLATALVVAVALSALADPAVGLTQRIVIDWHSGLAIGGYDPVAFFTDGKPMVGSGKFELSYDGAVWRFCNVGNRAAFAERPDVYMPQYGGYDPVALTRGLAVAGNPNLWAIVGARLFLFFNAAQRQKFLADSARIIAISQRKWPDMMGGLDP
jgi:YHS domain-containing protein